MSIGDHASSNSAEEQINGDDHLPFTTRSAERALKALSEAIGPRDFGVTLWDGTSRGPTLGQPSRFRLIVKDPMAVDAMLSASSDLALGEAYVNDQIDVEGDLGAAYPLVERLLETAKPTAGANLRSSRKLRGIHHPSRAMLKGRPHSKNRDRQAVQFHYDLSNQFFALWLDPRLVYSCAYFVTGREDLEHAQLNKLDYICRKLRLRAGERFLDVGCGWGALVMFAAQRYGVVAQGITLSKAQAKMANQRIRRAGLQGRCRVDVCDYRDLKPATPFDKIASIGMIEHVGESQLARYFTSLYRVLRSGGAVLNHGIVQPASAVTVGSEFVQRYVFPDGELSPLSTILRSAVLADFEPRDVESLREHYALTLRHWSRRLERHHAAARRIVGESTYRVWRLFMSISAYAFSAGQLNLYQTLLAKPDRGRAGLPLSRGDWYRARTKKSVGH